MMRRLEPYRRTAANLGPIIFRHVVVLVNLVVAGVVILLVIFGNREAALFLGAMTAFNILLGVVQDTRARLALETLQLLTALRAVRVAATGQASVVLAETLRRGDRIKLKLGDQVPCDGVLRTADYLEISEALITGEADSVPRAAGATVAAGSVVTAGTAILEATSDFRHGRVSRLTEAAKQYSPRPSPIQLAINQVIKLAGYILLAVLVVVVGRSWLVAEPPLRTVLSIGALAGTLVPQGLVVITTLLFAFGAASYARRHVLFQEINATEKLGRIKNLCLDKTGTLTDNLLTVAELCPAAGVSAAAVQNYLAAYVQGSGDASETLVAVKKYLGPRPPTPIITALPFSSWRQYGAVTLAQEETILVGAPEAFVPRLSAAAQAWWRQLSAAPTRQGQRWLAVARLTAAAPPRDLARVNLELLAVVALASGLREGIKETVDFFQRRGIRLRIISGDHPATVAAVARQAGVAETTAVVTGAELAGWSPAELAARVPAYTIFARIKPEQKVQIIQALKPTGFTAMVGDGANDVLAIKAADLGIAMFDGVPATRQLASVILVKNSFTDLPGGVTLADNFIRQLELFTAIYLNQSLVGLFFFGLISLGGYAYPLTPLNITLINYLAVGLPGLLIGYWAIWPRGKILPATSEGFLRRVLPFVAWCAVVEALGTALVFATSPTNLKLAWSNTLVALALVVFGLIFFALAPLVYRGRAVASERRQFWWLVLGELLLIGLILRLPWLVRFFDITPPWPNWINLLWTLPVFLVGGLIQFGLRRRFISSSR